MLVLIKVALISLAISFFTGWVARKLGPTFDKHRYTDQIDDGLLKVSKFFLIVSGGSVLMIFLKPFLAIGAVVLLVGGYFYVNSLRSATDD